MSTIAPNPMPELAPLLKRLRLPWNASTSDLPRRRYCWRAALFLPIAADARGHGQVFLA